MTTRINMSMSLFVKLTFICLTLIPRFLFWVEFGNNTQIGRAHMDGTTKIYIATADLGWPNGLAIDFACMYFIMKGQKY